MPQDPWWCMMLVACQVLVLSPALVDAHIQNPARAEVGWASWYGPRFHGRETASGERFSMHELTAAHRTLPLGTKVLVMNLETEAQIEVKITDRGPYVDPQHRIIDLSRAAAEGIGLRERGLGPVRVMISEEAPVLLSIAQAALYEVQLGAFLESEQAHEVLEQLSIRHPTAYVAAREGPIGRYYRVRVGPFETQPQAQQLARSLQQEGYAVFIDAVAAHTFPSQRFASAGEEHPGAITAVSGGEGSAAGKATIHVDSALIASIILLITLVASCLARLTWYTIALSRREAALWLNGRPP
jgi:rare lipoprotein A